MNLYDVVALLEDLPEYDLKRGQVGTLVEAWAPRIYEVEFADTQHRASPVRCLRYAKINGCPCTGTLQNQAPERINRQTLKRPAGKNHIHFSGHRATPFTCPF